MTVVIGLRLRAHVVLASDGYALRQDERDAPVVKTDAYSKLRVLPGGRIIAGSAGSHEVAVEVCEVEPGAGPEGQSEEAFLRQFASQLQAVNANPDGRRAAFMLGYLLDREPRLIVFTAAGECVTGQPLAALGSGADAALGYLAPRYRPDWNLAEAVGELVEAVYAASAVPTVNFLPMVMLLGRDGPHDLSPLTVGRLAEFRSELKELLAQQAAGHAGPG